jgi:hypothetical protein
MWDRLGEGPGQGRDGAESFGPWSLRPGGSASGAPRGSVGGPTGGFSVPRRTMRSRTSGLIGGRPERPLLLYVHFLLTSSRCQRSRVSGLTTNEDHWPLGIALLAAASRSRSRRRRRGRFTCRCSTLTWCRSTRSSTSLPSRERSPVPRTRPTRSRGARTAWISHRGERMLPAAPPLANRGF